MLAACALAAFAAQPADAQIAKKLKCSGCVKSKQIKNNRIKGIDVRDGSLAAVDLGNEAGGEFDVNTTSTFEVVGLSLAETVLRSVSLTAPSAGLVIVNASLTAQDIVSSAVVTCSISKRPSSDLRTVFGGRISDTSSNAMTFASTWGESVSAGTQTWNLLCSSDTVTTTALNPALTAIFAPTRY